MGWGWNPGKAIRKAGKSIAKAVSNPIWI